MREIVVPILTPKELIKPDIGLLRKYNIQLDALFLEFNCLILNDELTNTTYERIRLSVINILYKVGKLSDKHFKSEDHYRELFGLIHHNMKTIEKQFRKLKKEIHKPYDKLKNDLFLFLDFLDEQYMLKFKSPPPNYDSYDI